MAQRFGGKFSPGGGGTSAPLTDDTPLEAERAGARSNILFIPPVVMAFTSFGGGPVAMAMSLAGAALLLLAAWLTRDGVIAHQVYDARKVARRPALPRKMLGSVLIGAGLAVATFATSGVIGAVLTGLIGSGLHAFAFGPDPLRNKGMDGVDTFQQDRVAKVVDEGEATLATMVENISGLRDRHLNDRVENFAKAARKMFRTVEEDPRDLTGARKFIGVYLTGAKDAAVKFADLYRREKNPQARADFEALLDDLQTNFAAKTEKLLADNRSDMDVEIKVLRDRLQREGL